MRENLEKKRLGENCENEPAICGYKRFKRDVSQKAVTDSEDDDDDDKTELNSVISLSD